MRAHAADRDVERSTSSQVSVVAQGDLVRLGNVTGLDGPQPFTQSFAGLPQELERVGSGALRSGAIRISPVLLYEVCLKCRSDFVGCLQRVVDGPVSCGVVNHAVSITDPASRCSLGHAPREVPRIATG